MCKFSGPLNTPWSQTPNVCFTSNKCHTSTFPKHMLSEHGDPAGAAGDDGLHAQVLRPAGHPVVHIIDALATQSKNRVKVEFGRATHAPPRACYIARDSWVAAAAMRAHRSQWVWFRRLFLCMSRYTYVNTLYPLPPRHFK